MTPVLCQTHFKNPVLATLIITMAACSLLYELVLAQTLTAIFGGTVLRYSVTIALYILGLGMGAFFIEKKLHKNLVQKFFWTQFWLSMLGSFGFGLVVLLTVWQYSFPELVFMYAHGLILAIGFLSGVELPLANQLNKGKFTHTLSLDYWGALLGSVAFPLLFYPYFGLILTALIVSSLNALMCLYIAWSFNLSRYYHFVIYAVLICLIVLLSQKDKLITALQEIYITGNFNGA